MKRIWVKDLGEFGDEKEGIEIGYRNGFYFFSVGIENIC